MSGSVPRHFAAALQIQHVPLSPLHAGGRADHLDQLNLAGQRITGRAVQGGNAIRILQNGDEAYPEMLSAIEAAQRSIAMSIYLFRADATGRAFIDALKRASARGVAVRVR